MIVQESNHAYEEVTEKISKDIFRDFINRIQTDENIPKYGRSRYNILKAMIDERFDNGELDDFSNENQKIIKKLIKSFIGILSEKKCDIILSERFWFNVKTEHHDVEFILYTEQDFDLVDIIWSSKQQKNLLLYQSTSRFNEISRKTNRKPRKLRIFDLQKMKWDVFEYSEIKEIYRNMASKMESKLIDDIRKNDNQSSVIVLDIEGQYSENSDKIEKLSKIAPITKHFYDLRPNGDSTLGSIDLDPLEHMTNFMPSLSQKSIGVFRMYLENIKNKHTWKEDLDYEKLRSVLNDEIQDGTAFTQTKKSLSNAVMEFYSLLGKYFDDSRAVKKIDAERLLSPGLHSINVQGLSKFDQRIIAMYILAVLDSQKFQNNHSRRVFVAFDECHTLFQMVSSDDPDKLYLKRVYNNIVDIITRGRKRRFGVIFATQRAEYLAEDIRELPGTIITFESESKYTKSQFGDCVPNRIGQAAVKAKSIKAINKPYLINLFNWMDEISSRAKAEAVNESDLRKGFAGYIHETQKSPYKNNGKTGEFTAIALNSSVSLMNPGRLLYADKIYYCKDNKNKEINHDCNFKSYGCGKLIRTFHNVNKVSKAWPSYVARLQIEEEKSETVNQFSHKSYNSISPLSKEIIDVNGKSLSQEWKYRDNYYNNLSLKLPTSDIYYQAYDLPKKGLFLGMINESDTKFYLPFHPTTYEDGGEYQMDKSLLITGSSGRGKTNLLLQIIWLLAAEDINKTESLLLEHEGYSNLPDLEAVELEVINTV